ncbi:hypothetical protein D8674_009931 [Pyrus ussuriensis x Pyrus communis]|uniref:Uncharacterized protein n=1 Tax=Pyrus ussuriensis x Pyrus communis TaxID=2448454 RepID=A0A5N5FEQ5_9ROSA|nr:hypothetical protein D8674_009931 [Pyrus ussuriensis x Pyrus communis]
MFGFIASVSDGREGSEVRMAELVERISGGDEGRWGVVFWVSMAIEALKKISACLGPIVEVFLDFFIHGDGDEKEKQRGAFMAPIGRAAGKSYGGEGVGKRWWFGRGVHLGGGTEGVGSLFYLIFLHKTMGFWVKLRSLSSNFEEMEVQREARTVSWVLG